MAKKKKAQAEFSFEKSFDELQEIVNKLEEGNMSLGDSLKSYEVGITRLKECFQALNSAEQKIRQLVKLDEDGNLVTEQFEISNREEARPGRKSKTKENSAVEADELF